MAKQATLFSFLKKDVSKKSMESSADHKVIHSQLLIEESQHTSGREVQTTSDKQHDQSTEQLHLTQSRQDDIIVSSDEQIECIKSRYKQLTKITSYQHKLSDYELFRLRNIQRNHERLVALGLLDPNSQASLYENDVKRKNNSKRKIIVIKKSLDLNTKAVRRSTRNKHSISHLTSDVSKNADTVVPKEEEVVVPIFTDSPLVQHTFAIDNDEMSIVSIHQGPISSLSASKTYLVPPKPNIAWYSMDVRSHGYSEFIVAAGKGGVASLWNYTYKQEANHQNYEVEPILSWKGHGGRWISNVKFVSHRNDYNCLLSAGNDGCLSLWDLKSVNAATGAPRCLAITGSNLHSGGIFSMDLNSKDNKSSNVLVATGSKDKTVAVTPLESIEQGSSCKPLFVSKYHASKVGCVHMRGWESTLVGSASDDGSFAIHDYRSDLIVLQNNTAHMKPHSFVWHPSNNDIFVTAGYDDCIKVWDIRNPKECLITCKGHVPNTIKNIKRIHRPTFFQIKSIDNTHEYILSGSEKSGCISIFECNYIKPTENVVSVYSRGNLPIDNHGDVCCITTTDFASVYVSLSCGEIMILNPK